ncbi:transglutaminase-like domain-containing protein [Bacteroides sp.]|uniref:transglutaminase-like domain-containing protein n=1 Tax=Bacteroides sp. TaxID=29523 RepID=UPI0026133273|nr:transglutaminase-like domain-containing protein [Bacteroides sp.]MDD3039107.1 hypothetical protein [Bacteroides sp.]
MSTTTNTIAILFITLIIIFFGGVYSFNIIDSFTDFTTKTITLSNPSIKNPVTQTFRTAYNGQHYIINMDFDPRIHSTISQSESTLIIYSISGIDTQHIQQYMTHPSNTHLNPLITALKSISSNPQTQAKLAIRLVKNIPYDKNKQDSIKKGHIETVRYPYSTLYDNLGICSDQSYLLGYLLKELGFKTYYLGYSKPTPHVNIGIATTPQYSYKQTPYIIIEPTGTKFVFNSDYGYPSEITSPDPPFSVLISNGISLTDISKEYRADNRLLEIQSQNNIISAFMELPEYLDYYISYGLPNPTNSKS